MSKRFNLAGQMPLITLIVLCAVTALLTDRFLSPLNLTNILVQSSIMAVIAMGMTFVIVGGGFDLSVGSTVALAGLHRRHGDGEGRDRRRRGRPGSPPARRSGSPTGSSSPSSASIRSSPRSAPWCWCAASCFSSPAVRRCGDDGLPGAFVAFGSDRLLGIHYLVWVPAVLLAVLSFVMHATPYGRRVYATGGDREAAYLSGVPVRPRHRLDLCLVRRARRRRRRDARGAAAIRPADRRRVLRVDRHRRGGARAARRSMAAKARSTRA